MNIKNSKSIVNSGLPDEVIKNEVIKSISMDEDVIPIVMQILEQERQFNQ